MGDRRILLLTGRPGIGKTTVVRRVAKELVGWRLAGFTTEEIREAGRRLGFRALPLAAGEPRTIAHVQHPGPERVSRYGVDVAAIDRLAEETLPEPDPGIAAYLVDEIGKMECLSRGFLHRMAPVLASPALLLATVARRGGGLMAAIKERPDAELWEVTPANRDRLPEEAVRWLRKRRGVGNR